MPCRDYYDDHPEAYFREITEPALKKQISFAESALCATLDALQVALGKEPFDSIDYEEAGITKKELKAWRKKHKEVDAKHRELEKKLKLEQALAKLTDKDKRVLGLPT